MVSLPPSRLVEAERAETVDDLPADLVLRSRDGRSERGSQVMWRNAVLDGESTHNRPRNIGDRTPPPGMYGGDDAVTADENRHTVGCPYHQSDSGISGHQGIAAPHAGGVLEGPAGFCCQAMRSPDHGPVHPNEWHDVNARDLSSTAASALPATLSASVGQRQRAFARRPALNSRARSSAILVRLSDWSMAQ